MSTTLTGTLIDSLGQKWSNAPIQFIFNPTPSTPGPFNINGADFDKMPPPIMTDVNGFFSIVLPSNSEITPANSKWQMIIGPNSTYPATVLNLYLSTGALDISSLFTSSGAIKQVQSLMVPRAYADSEVIIPPNSGQLYYNVTDKVFKYYEGGNWAVLGGSSGGGMVYPPAGVAVSTGTGWAASIDPTLIPLENQANTFTADQHITGALTVTGNAELGAILFGPSKNRIFEASNARYIDAVSTTAARPLLILRQFANTTPAGIDSLIFDPNGSASFFGNITAPSGLITGNLNVNSFQIGGTAPVGKVLVGNGTNYIPTDIPAPPAPHLVVGITDYTGVPSSRDFGMVLQNGPNLRIVSGAGHTNGGTVGSTQGLIGAGSPTTQVWGMTVGSTLSAGVIGFSFSVPPNYFYVVQKNTLSQGPGGANGVTTIANWTEIDVSVA